jgi:hypothetical protein
MDRRVTRAGEVAASPSPRKRRRRASAGVSFAQVRTVALALPGVEDGTSYGTAALKVRGKLLARVHQELDALVLRVDLLDRHILMQAAPDAFFITDHYRDYPWVLMRFRAVEAGELPALIERAWRLVAPKVLLKKYDAAPSNRDVVRNGN